MSKTTECPKCQGRMSEGVLVDTGYGSYSVLDYQPGRPSVSRWLGLKVKPKELMTTRAQRCERCGFVELYAQPKESLR